MLDDTPLDLHFGWTPSRLLVTEKVTKNGHDSEMSYTLVVTEVEGGLAIEYRDFRFTAYDQLDLRNPMIRAEFVEIERTVATMQLGFRVTSRGAFAGLLDAESLVRGFEALQGAQGAAEFREMLENPQWRSLIEASVAKPWQAWVEVWIGCFDHEHQGRDPARPGHVRLRCEQRSDDERVIEVSLDPRSMIPAWAKDVMGVGESHEWIFEVVR